MEPIARTVLGTPVYLAEDVPERLLPARPTAPPPMGLLAEHLYSREDIPVPSCVLVRHRGTTRLYKLNESGLLLQISLKSIDAKDRNRLRKEGVMGRV